MSPIYEWSGQCLMDPEPSHWLPFASLSGIFYVWFYGNGAPIQICPNLHQSICPLQHQVQPSFLKQIKQICLQPIIPLSNLQLFVTYRFPADLLQQDYALPLHPEWRQSVMNQHQAPGTCPDIRVVSRYLLP